MRQPSITMKHGNAIETATGNSLNKRDLVEALAQAEEKIRELRAQKREDDLQHREDMSYYDER